MVMLLCLLLVLPLPAWAARFFLQCPVVEEVLDGRPFLEPSPCKVASLNGTLTFVYTGDGAGTRVALVLVEGDTAARDTALATGCTLLTRQGATEAFRPYKPIVRVEAGAVVYGADATRVPFGTLDQLEARATRQRQAAIERQRQAYWAAVPRPVRLVLAWLIPSYAYALGSFPDGSVVDTFTRANGDIGGSWVVPFLTGETAPQISSNALVSATLVSAYWNGYTVPNDADIWLTLVTNGGAQAGLRWGLRGDTDGAPDAYGPQINLTLTPDQWRIMEYIAGSTNTLAGPTDQAVASGEKIGFRASGTDLTSYYYNGTSWVQVNTASDATRTSGVAFLDLSTTAGDVMDDVGLTPAAGAATRKRAAPIVH